jgi:hypothetical protein
MADRIKKVRAIIPAARRISDRFSTGGFAVGAVPKNSVRLNARRAAVAAE